MRKLVGLGVLLLALSLAACLERTLPDDVREELQGVLDAVNSSEWTYVEARLPDEVSGETFSEAAASIEVMTGRQPFSDARLVRVVFLNETEEVGARYQATYALAYPDRALLLQVHLARVGDGYVISTFAMAPAAEGTLPGQSPPFTVADKPASQIALLGIAIFNPLFMIFTAVTAIRRRKKRPRAWLWGILSLIGVGQMSVVWETGVQSVQVLALGLFGAGAHTLNADPGWVLQIYFPLFALLYWFNQLDGRDIYIGKPPPQDED